MTITPIRKLSLAVAAFVAVWAAPVLEVLARAPHEGGEQGGGHGAEHGAHEVAHEGIRLWSNPFPLGKPQEDPRVGFVLLLINFGVLLLVLNKILFTPLRKANAEKSDAIRLELERAIEARAAADALVKEYEAKLTALEVEVEEIRTAAKASAEAEHVRIIAEANEQAEKIKAAAARAAEREAARLRTQLENEIVDQAMARAEKAIRDSFGGPDQRRLVDAWVNEVSATQIGGPN